MTAKELKASILDLSVRGKLVPQDPNDEPASVLLENIRAEKRKLVKAGKIKKEKNPSEIYIAADGKPYEKFANGSETCIEDEIPFELPKGWAWARLGGIALSITDGDHQPPPQTTTGIPFLVISNVSSGEASFERLRYVTPEYFASLSEDRKPAVGDLLFTVTGSYGIPIRIETNRDFCFQRHIALLKFPDLDTNFLKNVLESPFVKKQCDDIATGTAQKTIPLTGLRNILIPLPPFNEQQRILTKIKALTPLLKSYFDLKQALNDSEAAFPDILKKSILQYAVEGKLVPQDPNDEPASALVERIAEERKALVKAGKLKRDKNESVIFRGADRLAYETRNGETVCIEDELPFKIPETWAWVRLGSIVFNHGQKAPTESFCYIDIGSIDNKQNKLSEYDTVVALKDASSRARKIVCQGDVIYSCVRPYLHNLCIIDREFSKMPIASTGFAVMAPHTGLFNKFLFYYLLSPQFDDYANDAENAKGVAYPTISDKRLYDALLPLPPLAEQKRIVEQIEKMLKASETLTT